MKRVPHRFPFAALCLAAALAGGGIPGSKGAAPPVTAPPRLPEPPPTPPPAPSPVDRFRELLAMAPAAREQFLASRTPEQRAYLQARLAEFDALPAADRELRLHLLSLRYYLLPLLRLTPEQRGEELRRVPPEYRALVTERLTAWDRLPPAQREELLASEPVFSGLPLLGDAGRAVRRSEAAQLPPAQRRQIEHDLERWEAIPAEDRARITRHFESFLTFTAAEKAKVLARLDATDREKATRMLRALDELTDTQRAQVTEALERFSALPPAQRERFLQNAARWQAMSTEERLAWRRLRAALPPPPGFQSPPPLPQSAPPPLNTNARVSP